jgi:hypothetical protein
MQHITIPGAFVLLLSLDNKKNPRSIIKLQTGRLMEKVHSVQIVFHFSPQHLFQTIDKYLASNA